MTNVNNRRRGRVLSISEIRGCTAAVPGGAATAIIAVSNRRASRSLPCLGPIARVSVPLATHPLGFSSAPRFSTLASGEEMSRHAGPGAGDFRCSAESAHSTDVRYYAGEAAGYAEPGDVKGRLRGRGRGGGGQRRQNAHDEGMNGD